MEIFKILGIAIITCFTATIVKQVKSEFYVFVVICGSILISILILNQFTTIFAYFNGLIEKTGIDSSLFVLIIRVIGVAYLIEFATDICLDTNNLSIANKISLAGKVIIICMALPVITNLFNMIIKILP